MPDRKPLMDKPEYRLVSLSGGKDSTAMLLRMLEEGMKIDCILFCDIDDLIVDPVGILILYSLQPVLAAGGYAHMKSVTREIKRHALSEPRRCSDNDYSFHFFWVVFCFLSVFLFLSF